MVFFGGDSKDENESDDDENESEGDEDPAESPHPLVLLPVLVHDRLLKQQS